MKDNTRCEASEAQREMSREEKAKCFIQQLEQKAKRLLSEPCGCLMCKAYLFIYDNREKFSMEEIEKHGKFLNVLNDISENVHNIARVAGLDDAGEGDPRPAHEVYEDAAKFIEEKLEFPHYAKATRVLGVMMKGIRDSLEGISNERNTFEKVLHDRADAKERAQKDRTI